MLQLLERLKKHVVIGFVGGSDLDKQKEQLGENVIDNFDFGFSENGATAYRLGQLISKEVRTGDIQLIIIYYLLMCSHSLDSWERRGINSLSTLHSFTLPPWIFL